MKNDRETSQITKLLRTHFQPSSQPRAAGRWGRHFGQAKDSAVSFHMAKSPGNQRGQS